MRPWGLTRQGSFAEGLPLAAGAASVQGRRASSSTATAVAHTPAAGSARTPSCRLQQAHPREPPSLPSFLPTFRNAASDVWAFLMVHELCEAVVQALPIEHRGGRWVAGEGVSDEAATFAMVSDLQW